MSGCDKMSYPKWGYLRETKAKAEKAGVDKETGLHRTGLEEYLKVIFPEVNDWVHDQRAGLSYKGKKLQTRPDYRSEKLKLIIEFDGIQHYTKPDVILKDNEKVGVYTLLGYKVVRIPYFIQLTNNTVKRMFGVSVSEPLFDLSIPSLSASHGSPAYLCHAGIERMAKEFAKFPDQYEVNLNALKKLNNDALTGVSLLESAYKKYAK